MSPGVVSIYYHVVLTTDVQIGCLSPTLIHSFSSPFRNVTNLNKPALTRLIYVLEVQDLLHSPPLRPTPHIEQASDDFPVQSQQAAAPRKPSPALAAKTKTKVNEGSATRRKPPS